VHVNSKAGHTKSATSLRNFILYEDRLLFILIDQDVRLLHEAILMEPKGH
jgi:hypothetical protein